MLSIIRDIKLRLLERCTSTESGLFAFLGSRPGAGGPLYDGLYGEAPPEMGIFFRLQVYERVEISLVEVEGREI